MFSGRRAAAPFDGNGVPWTVSVIAGPPCRLGGIVRPRRPPSGATVRSCPYRTGGAPGRFARVLRRLSYSWRMDEGYPCCTVPARITPRNVLDGSQKKLKNDRELHLGTGFFGDSLGSSRLFLLTVCAADASPAFDVRIGSAVGKHARPGTSAPLTSSDNHEFRAGSRARGVGGDEIPLGQRRSLMLFPNICPQSTAGQPRAPVDNRRIYRLAFKREVSIYAAKRAARSAIGSDASSRSGAPKTSPSCSSGNSPV